MDDKQVGYLAGIVDGEGCVYVNRRKATGRRKTPGYSVKLIVSTTSAELVDWFKVHAKLTSVHYVDNPGPNRKPKWLCTWNNTKAESILADLLPLLVIKKKQAELGLELLRHLKAAPKGGACNVVPPETVAYRESIKQQIAALNYRGRTPPKPVLKVTITKVVTGD